jgi:exopolysaccharide production protein ExoZ
MKDEDRLQLHAAACARPGEGLPVALPLAAGAGERHGRDGEDARRGWLARRFELSRHGAASNVRPMEGLRGFAVFIVFLVHYVSTLDGWIPRGGALHQVAAAMHTVGTSGVDLFFVLSGYLIYGSLMARPQRFGAFMARRWQRIYPAFVAVFALYVALSYALPGQSRIPGSPGAAAGYLLANLLLLPGLFPIEPLITVAWSLSNEMFYYLAVPLVIAAAGLRRRSRAARVALCMGMAVAIAAACALRGGPVELILFLAGMLLHEALAAPPLPAPGAAVALTALAAAWGAMLVPTAGPAGFTAKVALLFVAFFLLCHECFSRPHGRLARGFAWTPLRWLGNMSYSYYLLHGLALKAAFVVLERLVPPQALDGWQFWALLPPMFALSLLPAAVLFLAVERPLSLAPGRARRGRAMVQPMVEVARPPGG